MVFIYFELDGRLKCETSVVTILVYFFAATLVLRIQSPHNNTLLISRYPLSDRVLFTKQASKNWMLLLLKSTIINTLWIHLRIAPLKTLCLLVAQIASYNDSFWSLKSLSDSVLGSLQLGNCWPKWTVRRPDHSFYIAPTCGWIDHSVSFVRSHIF